MIQVGLCDAAVVGGADSLCRMTLHGFGALELISPVPCRPCAPDRAGISSMVRDMSTGDTMSEDFHAYVRGRAAALRRSAYLLCGDQHQADEVGLHPEPLGGAHTDATGTASNLKIHLVKHLEEVLALPVAERLQQRYKKFRAHGHFVEEIATADDNVPQAGG